MAFAQYITSNLSSLANQNISKYEANIQINKAKEISIFPFSGSSTREWPLSLYIRLAAQLRIELPDTPVTLIADEANAWKLDKYSLKLSDLSINVKFPKNVTGIIDHLRKGTGLVICNNSGPAWISSHLNIPFIGIYSGAVDPIHWLPPGGVVVRRNVSCSPCHIASANQCNRNLLCLNSISPIEVSSIIKT